MSDHRHRPRRRARAPGNPLQAMRLAAGMTQKQVADRLGPPVNARVVRSRERSDPTSLRIAEWASHVDALGRPGEPFPPVPTTSRSVGNASDST